MNHVTLQHVHGFRMAWIREVCGQDEQLVADTSTITAIRLLDQMLIAQTDSDLPPGSAAKLTVFDRDKLLAVIYQQNFASQVESTVRCMRCDKPFDLDFRIDELMKTVQREATETDSIHRVNGEYLLPDGVRFRLPTGDDELAIIGFPHKEARQVLLSRCITQGDLEHDGEKVEEAIKRLSPIAETDLNAICPECSYEQPVFFSLQAFVLGALRNERSRLIQEVHYLAKAYGWTRDEILNLPRSQRKAYVELIESELSSQY